MIFIIIFGALAFLSALLNLWQWVTALRFPLYRHQPVSSTRPAFSVLKPLKGCDAETRGCLESWFLQTGVDMEILFAVADENDPVCAVVRELQAAHPNVPSTLSICPIGDAPNAKAAKLAVLESNATLPLVVISDADVRAPNDLLQQIGMQLSGGEIAVVNCFYILANPTNLAMRWEALSVNADFWSQVLQARDLKPQNFALGAVMAMPRATLLNVGGFRALTDFLADDYQLGARVAAAGGKIELSTLPVECREAPLTWKQAWQHQMRWARTIRVCQPVPYFFSILNNATLWPVCWIAAGFSHHAVALATASMIVVRVLMAGHLQSRLTRKSDHWAFAWMAPLKDLIGFIVWAGALGGSTVLWRNREYRVLPGGRMILKETALPSGN